MKEKRIRVGDLVQINNYNPTFNGKVGTVLYTNTPDNMYFVGEFPALSYRTIMDIRRRQMTVITKEEHPELFI